MKSCSTLFFVLLLPRLVVAQAQPDSVVADTLDWQRYYPLEIGNVWEYRVTEGEPLLRREIVGDTSAMEKSYFMMEEVSYDYDYVGGGTDLEVWTRDTLFVRYDTLGTVIVLQSPEADTAAVPRNMPLGDSTYGFFDLRASFGDTIYFGEGTHDYYWTRGGYDETVEIGSDVVGVPAAKIFQSSLWSESYAMDVGFLGGGNLWGPRITYANVAGVEYGVSRTPTAVQQAVLPEGFEIEAIYPNPARGEAVATYRLSSPQTVTMEVFNVLGQRVWSRMAPAKSVGRHSQQLDTSTWAAGTYYLRTATGNGGQSIRTFVLVR